MNYPLKSPGLASKDDINNLIPFIDYTSYQNDNIASSQTYVIPYACLAVFTMTSGSDIAFQYSISVNGKAVILEMLGVGLKSCNTLIFKGGEKIKWTSDSPATLEIKIFKLQSI